MKKEARLSSRHLVPSHLGGGISPVKVNMDVYRLSWVALVGAKIEPVTFIAENRRHLQLHDSSMILFMIFYSWSKHLTCSRLAFRRRTPVKCLGENNESIVNQNAERRKIQHQD